MRNQIYLKPNFNLSKSCSGWLPGNRDSSEDFGIGFTGFGQMVKKLRAFEDQGPICDKNNCGSVPGRKIKRKA